MQLLSRTKHSIDAVFSVLLFGLFALILLLLVLFSAEAYKISVNNLKENQNLHTAMTYVTTKVRQHDEANAIYPGTIENMTALCLNDQIGDEIYTTYIYFDGLNLKELFTVPEASVSAALGTTIAELNDFQIEWTTSGFLKLYMEDIDGRNGELLLHPSSPNTTFKEEHA